MCPSYFGLSSFVLCLVICNGLLCLLWDWFDPCVVQRPVWGHRRLRVRWYQQSDQGACPPSICHGCSNTELQSTFPTYLFSDFFWWAGLAVWPGACQGCRYVDQGTLFALLVKCFDPWYCESVVVFPSPQNGSHFGVSRSVSKAGVTLEGLLPVEPVGWGGLVGWIHQIM